MKEEIRSVEFAPGKVLSVETGRIAKQADGAVVVRMEIPRYCVPP